MDQTQANAIVKDLKDRFTWESDGRLDSYHIMPSEGEVSGDCDDFAVTVLYEMCDRNFFKMVMWIVFCKAVFWHVTSARGNPHAVLYVRGYGYTDNWRDSFSPTEDLHKKRWPLWIIPLFKLVIGLFDKT